MAFFNYVFNVKRTGMISVRKKWSFMTCSDHVQQFLENNSIKQRINYQYLQLQNAEIHKSQKLRFLQEIYNMWRRPHYVIL